MTDFTYTEEWYPKSSLVEGVFFNANENFVVLDLNDEIYRYDDVTRDDVKKMLDADSVGSYYNLYFKQQHGPSEHLGEYDEVDWEKVPVENKPTKEFSLSGTISADNVVEGNFPTKEFSLQPIQSVSVEDDSDVTSTVFFTLAGGDKVYEFGSNKTSLEDAINEVNTFVTRVNGKGNVVKVVFEFE
jgi:hypothetical protein